MRTRRRLAETSQNPRKTALIALVLLSLSRAARADEACVVATPAEQAAEVWRLDVQGDHAAAAKTIVTAYACLGSVKNLVEPADLSHLFQWGGTAALHDGKPEDAARYFEAAVRMSDAVGFDPRLGDAAHDAYAAAESAMQKRGKGTVHARSEVWVDGVRVDEGQDRVLPVGEHLVQWIDHDNLVNSQILSVALGDPVAVGPEAVVVPCEPVLSTVQHPKPPVARLVASSALVAAGAVALFASGIDGWGLYSQDDQTGDDRMIAGLNFGGGIAIALGTASLFVAAVQSPSSTSISTFAIPVLFGRW